MKKFKLLSLIGITSLALAHAGSAAGHGGGGGGGGGGFHAGGFGAGGFHGSGFHGGGFRGGAFHGGGFRGERFGSGGFHGRGFRGDRFGHHRFSNDVFIGGFGFRWCGAGTIRKDITVTTITRTITMDMAGTHIMATADTATMVGPVTVTDTAMAADQGISAVREV